MVLYVALLTSSLEKYSESVQNGPHVIGMTSHRKASNCLKKSPWFISRRYKRAICCLTYRSKGKLKRFGTHRLEVIRTSVFLAINVRENTEVYFKMKREYNLREHNRTGVL